MEDHHVACILFPRLVMSLSLCRNIVGFSNLISEDPLVAAYRDVLYVPDGIEGAAAGAYHRTRKILPGGGHVVGAPTLCYRVGSPFTSLDPEEYDFAEEQDYVFVGHLHTEHYGHFLVGGLARFWFLDTYERRRPKLLYVDQRSAESLLAPAFARLIFQALGITADDFIRFDKPKRIRNMKVASTSFEENNCVHAAYARMCNRLGDLLTRDSVARHVDRPVYLSKHKLKHGVSTVLNEDHFCRELEKQGVDIVCPETLDLVEQINLFRSRPVVTGFIGSAFHTSAFVPRCKLLILNHGPSVWSNQILQDKANQNESLYLYPKARLANQGTNGSFGNNFILADPEIVAADFRRAIEAYQRAFERDTESENPRNVALRKPTRQSSDHPFANSSRVPISRHGAVSGFLTGSYQFHTDNEERPWWQVDLLGPHRITEVRIHNRLDDASWRASRLVGLVSNDGQYWTELFRRDEASPFGGIDGHPFVWMGEHKEPIRLLRLQILAHEDFHLDQVEIIGVPEKRTSMADTVPPEKAAIQLIGASKWRGWLPRALRHNAAKQDSPPDP